MHAGEGYVDLTDPGEERKALAALVGKFYLPDTLDERHVKGLAILAQAVRERAEESTLRTACTRLEAALEKRYAPLFANWAPSQAAADGTLQTDAFADLRSLLDALPPVRTEPRRVRRTRTRKDPYVYLHSPSDESDEASSSASESDA